MQAILNDSVTQKNLTIGVDVEAPAQAMTAVVTGAELFLPLQA